MAKFSVLMHPLVSVSVEAESAELAARYARDRILGVLREMPSEFTSIGFQPEFTWTVREDGERRPGLTLIDGVDADLR